MIQINQYTLEETPLGSGGMGQVLKGTDANGRPVAVKEILPQFVSNPEYRTRIDREIAFLRKFRDPHVVTIYDHFEQNGNLYIVMELVEGKNLDDYVHERGPLSLQDASKLMVKILRAMQYIHEQGIVHRDLKPSNVMLRPNGEICILDFGIAKNTSAQQTYDGDRPTEIGTVLGTDGYMSPEQAGGMAIDFRTDIYSLGCVLFYLLTGRHAFIYDPEHPESSSAIANRQLPRLKNYLPDSPDSVQELLDRATDLNMLRRYQSCREFANDLDKFSAIGTHINSGVGTNEVSVSIGRENCDICISLNNNKVSRHHCDVKIKVFTGGTYYVITDCSTNGTIVDGQKLTRGQSYNIQPDQNPMVLISTEPPEQLNWQNVKAVLNEKLRLSQLQDVDTGDYDGPTLKSEELNRKYGVSPSGAPNSASSYNPDNTSDIFRPKPNPNSAFNNNGYKPGPNPYKPYNSQISTPVPPVPAVPPQYPWGVPPQPTTGTMGFGRAISTCFKKYADFNGRAGRAEYWWWVLFVNLVPMVSSVLGWAIAYSLDSLELLVVIFVCLALFSLATFLPTLAVMIRRLHDTGHSWGAWLLCLIPIANIVFGIMLLVYLLKAGDPAPNEYGNPV